MSNRKEYRMTNRQFVTFCKLCLHRSIIVLPGRPPVDVKKNAEQAWNNLGQELGFKPKSAKFVKEKGDRYFTAEEL